MWLLRQPEAAGAAEPRAGAPRAVRDSSRDEMPSCGCDGHISRRDTATLCVVLLLVALHLGFGYLWLHNYRSHVETTGVEG